jgi:hypothetical protein
MLRELLASGMKPRLIARKLKRSIGGVQSRIFLFFSLKSPANGFRRNAPDLPI